MLQFHLSCACFYPWETQGNEVEKWFFLVLLGNEEKDSITIKTTNAEPERWNSRPWGLSPEWGAVSISLFWSCLDRHRDRGSVRTRGQLWSCTQSLAVLAAQCCMPPAPASFHRSGARTARCSPCAPRSAGHRGNALCSAMSCSRCALSDIPTQHPQVFHRICSHSSAQSPGQTITPATSFILLLVKEQEVLFFWSQPYFATQVPWKDRCLGLESCHQQHHSRDAAVKNTGRWQSEHWRMPFLQTGTWWNFLLTTTAR